MTTETPQLKFGALPTKSDPLFRTLRLEQYVNRSVLPTPPPTWRIPVTPTSWPMFGNDRIGDCYVAAVGHQEQVWSAAIGQENVYSEADVENTYWSIGDLEHPNQPHTDQGLYGLDVMNWYAKQGVAGDKILAFVKVLPQDLQLAMMLFNGVFVAFHCQANVLNEFNNGQPWQPGTLINEGHAINAIEYNQSMLKMVSWAREQWGTYAWAQQTVMEYWACIPDEFLKAVPAGFDLEQLWADLAAIRTPDSPVVPPFPFTPTPAPPSPVPPTPPPNNKQQLEEALISAGQFTRMGWSYNDLIQQDKDALRSIVAQFTS